MKLKKIISAIIAFSMISAMGISNASAADYTNPVIHVDSEVFTDTSATNYKPVDGYTTYLVSYSMEGIDYSNGAQLNAFTADYTVSGESGVDYLAKSFSKPVTSGPANKKDLNGIYSMVGGLQMISAKQIVFASADGVWDHVDWDTYENGSPANVKTLPLIQTLIYVKDGSNVTFTYNTEIVDSQTSSMMEFADGTKYSSNIVYNVNGKASNKLVLGESEPDGKGVEVKDGDTVIGTVWNNVVFEDVANTAYNLIFTDAEGNVKPGEGDIDFGELSGDVTVAVILNSARAGVTLQVVPVE